MPTIVIETGWPQIRQESRLAGSTAFLFGSVIQCGDVLLGIGQWQTTDLHDVALIATKQGHLAATGKTKFYVLRNGHTLFGYLDLPKP